MPADVMEEELLRSIEEIDNQIKSFRQRVRAVLNAAQAEGDGGGSAGSSSED